MRSSIHAAKTCKSPAPACRDPFTLALFCTDGITDAFDRKGEQFGIERLQELCEAKRITSPAEFLGRIFAAVESFARGQEQHDDMAAALFHLCG
jgi:hypothetical protein